MKLRGAVRRASSQATGEARTNGRCFPNEHVLETAMIFRCMCGHGFTGESVGGNTAPMSSPQEHHRAEFANRFTQAEGHESRHTGGARQVDIHI
jgi:hypothetical protein